MAGRGLGAVAACDVKASVPCGAVENDLPRDLWIAGYKRGHERAAAPVGQLRRVGQIAIGHQGRNRAKGFEFVNRLGRVRVIALQQGRREKSAIGAGADQIERFRVAGQTDGFAGKGVELAEHVLFLSSGGERAHADGVVCRVTDRGLRQPFHQRLADVLHRGFRDDDAADGGAFLTSLGGDLVRGLLDEGVEFRGAGGGVGAKDRRVQAVLFGMEPHRIAHQRGVGAQVQGSIR